MPTFEVYTIEFVGLYFDESIFIQEESFLYHFVRLEVNKSYESTAFLSIEMIKRKYLIEKQFT